MSFLRAVFAPKISEWQWILMAVLLTSALVLGDAYLSDNDMQQAVGRSVRLSGGLAIGRVLGVRFWNRRKERTR